MSKQLIVVVDTDAIIAQTNSDDIHHEHAVLISKFLVEQNAQVLYPITTILEAGTHIQRVLNSTATAYDQAQLMASHDAQVVEVNKQILINGLKYFSHTTSKKNTLFDCVVLAIADDKNADAIFSFDKFYKKKGFTLVSELIK